MDKSMVISFRTVLLIFLTALGVYVAYLLIPIFVILLIAGLITVALEPLVSRLSKKIRRDIAVYLVYLGLIAVVSLVVTLVIPPLASQVQKFISSLPRILESSDVLGRFGISYSTIATQLSQVVGKVFNLTGVVVSNILGLVSIVFISLYMSIDWVNIKRRFAGQFAPGLRDKVENVLKEIETVVSHWVKGQGILMLVVGLATFVGLYAVGIEYALALAVIAGFLEIVPMLGPVIATVIAALVGFGESPVKGIAVVAVCVVIQQLENNVLVPRIMHKVSGFSPLVILVSVLVGTKFFGITGAILAVPVVMVGILLIRRFLISAESA